MFIRIKEEMEKIKEMVFIKGKEAVIANILLLCALVLFIIPIVLIFFLRFLYKSLNLVKEQTIIHVPVDGMFEKG